MEGEIPYQEKHWLTYGIDYTVSELGAQDTGGELTLISPIPVEAEQLVIMRVTPRTQEADLHNGSRLAAEQIESIGDKLTMQTQELGEQIFTRDEANEILHETNIAVEEEARAREQADAELQGNIDGEKVERKQADMALQDNIDAEEVERKKADAELQGNIDAEARAREDADQNLLRQILTIVPEGLVKLPEYIAGLPEEFEAIRNEVSAKADDAAVVKLTGDQTIGGVKTFSISPKVPNKTTAAANDGTLIATEAQIPPIIQKQDVYGHKTFGLFVKEGINFSGKNNILLEAALQYHAGISERRLATWGDVLFTITGNPDDIKP